MEPVLFWSLLFLIQQLSGAWVVGCLSGPSVTSGFGGRLPRLEICAYHTMGDVQYQVVASRGFQRGVARKFFQGLFAREKLTEQETRHELDLAHQHVSTCADEYSKTV